jgi:hypothetical protein
MAMIKAAVKHSSENARIYQEIGQQFGLGFDGIAAL